MPTKGIEYLMVLGYLALFIPFWKYFVAGRGEAVHAHVRAAARTAARVLPRLPAEDMFRVPDGVWFHPGHVWARPEGQSAVAVGIDDFARQLVGPLVGVLLPEVGTRVEQGMPAMTLQASGKTVDVLSPVTGRVRAINPAALRSPKTVNDDPYGTGWLLEIDAPRLNVDTRQLMAGRAAQQWMTSSWEDLSTMVTPQMGTILHDGGTPIDGFARGIDHEHWDTIARRFLRTEETDTAEDDPPAVRPATGAQATLEDLAQPCAMGGAEILPGA